MLKANVTVFRHADRTPKQKLKYNFPVSEEWTQPFIKLLNGEHEEIILRERSQLKLISEAIEEARKIIEQINGDDPDRAAVAAEDLAKLTQLNSALERKIDLPGTKAQLKPSYKKIKASVLGGVSPGGTVTTTGVANETANVGALVTPGGATLQPAAAILVKKGGNQSGKRLEKFQLVFKWGGEVRVGMLCS